MGVKTDTSTGKGQKPSPFAKLFFFSLLSDAFLRNRSEADHEATAMMKAEFMSLWDGLETGTNCQVPPPRSVDAKKPGATSAPSLLLYICLF